MDQTDVITYAQALGLTFGLILATVWVAFQLADKD